MQLIDPTAVFALLVVVGIAALAALTMAAVALPAARRGSLTINTIVEAS